MVSKPSRVEPLIAPGLITNGLTNIHLLCANLNKTVIKIQKNQIIGHLNLNGIESVFEIYSFGNLTKLGLPSDTNLVNLTLDTETLDKIPSEYKDTAIKLFRDYDDVFAQSNTNIGKYVGGAHKIDTGLHPLTSPKPSDILKPLKKLLKLRFQNSWSLVYWSNHTAHGPPRC